MASPSPIVKQPDFRSTAAACTGANSKTSDHSDEPRRPYSSANSLTDDDFEIFGDDGLSSSSAQSSSDENVAISKVVEPVNERPSKKATKVAAANKKTNSSVASNVPKILTVSATLGMNQMVNRRQIFARKS